MQAAMRTWRSRRRTRWKTPACFCAAVKKSDKIVQMGTQRRSTPRLSEGGRVYQVGQVRRHRDGRDELERESAWTLAAS